MVHQVARVGRQFYNTRHGSKLCRDPAPDGPQSPTPAAPANCPKHYKCKCFVGLDRVGDSREMSSNAYSSVCFHVDDCLSPDEGILRIKSYFSLQSAMHPSLNGMMTLDLTKTTENISNLNTPDIDFDIKQLDQLIFDPTINDLDSGLPEAAASVSYPQDQGMPGSPDIPPESPSIFNDMNGETLDNNFSLNFDYNHEVSESCCASFMDEDFLLKPPLETISHTDIIAAPVVSPFLSYNWDGNCLTTNFDSQNPEIEAKVDSFFTNEEPEQSMDFTTYIEKELETPPPPPPIPKPQEVVATSSQKDRFICMLNGTTAGKQLLAQNQNLDNVKFVINVPATHSRVDPLPKVENKVVIKTKEKRVRTKTTTKQSQVSNLNGRLDPGLLAALESIKTEPSTPSPIDEPVPSTSYYVPPAPVATTTTPPSRLGKRKVTPSQKKMESYFNTFNPDDEDDEDYLESKDFMAVEAPKKKISLKGLSDADKYKRIREQNNAASKRCREKRKEKQEQLKRDVEAQEKRNYLLIAESNRLKERVEAMKKLMASCNSRSSEANN